MSRRPVIESGALVGEACGANVAPPSVERVIQSRAPEAVLSV
ncbi:MAG: hypothetical protein U0166_21465 [Acidobacteriota bacterium]